MTMNQLTQMVLTAITIFILSLGLQTPVSSHTHPSTQSGVQQ